MPTLPTLTVTQAQADRLLAAFGTVENYKAWLKENLINYVIDYENASKFDQVRSQQATALTDLQNQLSGA